MKSNDSNPTSPCVVAVGTYKVFSDGTRELMPEQAISCIPQRWSTHPSQNPRIPEAVYRATIEQARWGQYGNGRYLQLRLSLEDGTLILTNLYFPVGYLGATGVRFEYLCGAVGLSVQAVQTDATLLQGRPIGVEVRDQELNGRIYSDVGAFLSPAVPMDAPF
jgi:hypothetical protein